MRPPDGATVDRERHRPKQTTLYRLVRQHAATFVEQAEVPVGPKLLQFVKGEFDALLECNLAHGFPLVLPLQPLARRFVLEILEAAVGVLDGHVAHDVTDILDSRDVRRRHRDDGNGNGNGKGKQHRGGGRSRALE